MEQLEAKLEDTNRRLSQLSQQIAETQGDLLRLRERRRRGDDARRSARGRAGFARRPAARPGAGRALAVRALRHGVRATTPRGDTPSRSRDSRTTSRPIPRPTSPTTPSTGSASRTSRRRSIRRRSPTSTELLKQWPASDKAAAALLKKGYALLELGQKAEGVVQLQYVIHEFPSSEEARLARARLKTLGVDAK